MGGLHCSFEIKNYKIKVTKPHDAQTINVQYDLEPSWKYYAH